MGVLTHQAFADRTDGGRHTCERAEMFCNTVYTKLLPLPDHVEVFPTHVAGSLCGGNIGSRLSTTVGYERRTNPTLAEAASIQGADEIVRACLRLDDLPAVPPYWRRMRTQNLQGVAPLGLLAEPPALTVEQFAAQQDAGVRWFSTRALRRRSAAPTCRVRSTSDSARRSQPGPGQYCPTKPVWCSYSIGPTMCGRSAGSCCVSATRPPLGWLGGGITGWRTAARPLQSIPQITVYQLKRLLDRGGISLLDVRQPNEWEAGHVPGARYITGAELPDRLGELRGIRPLAVTCGSGYRSSVVASLLDHHGHLDVMNVAGGMAA
jgi:hydroxyacylglutathione hydrolase